MMAMVNAAAGGNLRLSKPIDNDSHRLGWRTVAALAGAADRNVPTSRVVCSSQPTARCGGHTSTTSP